MPASRAQLAGTSDSGASRFSLDAKYQVPKSPRKTLCKGTLFRTCWSEPAGVAVYDSGLKTNIPRPSEYPTAYGERAYGGIKIFVVIEEHQGHVQCWRINTYGDRGFEKPGAIKSEHVTAYSGSMASQSLGGKIHKTAKSGLSRPAIRIVIETGASLKPSSVLNTAKSYPIEHNLKMLICGRVHSDSMPDFEQLIKHRMSYDEPGCPRRTPAPVYIDPHQPVWDLDMLLDSLVIEPKDVYQELSGDGSEEEEPDEHYSPRPASFFRKYKVFVITRWKSSDPITGEPRSSATEAVVSQHGERLFTSPRLWFVVIKEGEDYSYCVRIRTYHGEGVGEGYIKSQHAIAHCGKGKPTPSYWEQPKAEDRSSMKESIRIKPGRKRNLRSIDITPQHRFCFNRIYKVGHNVNVHDFGTIHDDYHYQFARHVREGLSQSSFLAGFAALAGPTDREDPAEEISSSNEDNESTESPAAHSAGEAPLRRFHDGQKVLLPYTDKQTRWEKFMCARVERARLVDVGKMWEYRLVHMRGGVVFNGEWIQQPVLRQISPKGRAEGARGSVSTTASGLNANRLHLRTGRVARASGSDVGGLMTHFASGHDHQRAAHDF